MSIKNNPFWKSLNKDIEINHDQSLRELKGHYYIYQLSAQIGIIFGLFMSLVDKVGYATSLSGDEIKSLMYLGSPEFLYTVTIFSIGLYVYEHFYKRREKNTQRVEDVMQKLYDIGFSILLTIEIGFMILLHYF